jgi:DNA-binding NarL/FixJ family response regulator
VIADDHPGVLAMAVRILESEYDVVAQVSDGHALVEAVHRFRADVAVVDIAMPGLNGIEAVRRFRPLSRTVVVFLTGQSDPGLIKEAFSSGGLGYVLKAFASEDLIPAVESALAGERFLSPSLK